MKLELSHGDTLDLDPAAAALDESLLRALRRWGPSSQADLWYRSSAQLGTREAFTASLDRLVDGSHIVRQATNRKNRFIYRVSPDKRRSERAAARRREVAPLTPEVV